MARSGEKNSLHHATIAQEIMKISSICGYGGKNRLHYGAMPAQKELKFFPICQRAPTSLYFMMRRARVNRIKRDMRNVLLKLSSFCAFETGI
jgi:hypothetical protein